MCIEISSDTNYYSGSAVVIGFSFVILMSVVVFGIYSSEIAPVQAEDNEIQQYNSITYQMETLMVDINTVPQSGIPKTRPFSPQVEYPTLYPGVQRPDTISSTEQQSVQVTADGSTVLDSESRVIRYNPNFNEYQTAETVMIEHQVLGSEGVNGSPKLINSGQQLIAGDSISIVTVDGEFRTASSRNLSVQVRPDESYSTQSVSVSNQLVIEIETNYTEAMWNDVLLSERVENGGNIESISKSGETLSITLESGEYTVNTGSVSIQSLG
jgi:hypothetical protein